MKVFGECFFYEYYLSIFVTATNKQIYLPMPNSSACRGKKQCAQCPKAVDNAIIYASHLRGFHLPARKCEENIIIFLLKGEVLVNSKEYAGTVLHAGEFILQAIGSKYEILAMTDVECVCYRFSKPEFFCEDRYNHIMKEVTPPLIFYPLTITPELQLFLESSKAYLSEEKICREMLCFKRKELAFILGNYYSLPLLCLAESCQSQDGRGTCPVGRIYSSYFPAYIQFCFSSTGVRVDDGTEEGKRGL